MQSSPGFSKNIARLLGLAIVWNFFCTMAIATPMALEKNSIVQDNFNDLAFSQKSIISAPSDDTNPLPFGVDEFVTEEEETNEEQNKLHLDKGIIREQFSLPPPSSLNSVTEADFTYPRFFTGQLYIRYCALKIPFSLS